MYRRKRLGVQGVKQLVQSNVTQRGIQEPETRACTTGNGWAKVKPRDAELVFKGSQETVWKGENVVSPCRWGRELDGDADGDANASER